LFYLRGSAKKDSSALIQRAFRGFDRRAEAVAWKHAEVRYDQRCPLTLRQQLDQTLSEDPKKMNLTKSNDPPDGISDPSHYRQRL